LLYPRIHCASTIIAVLILLGLFLDVQAKQTSYKPNILLVVAPSTSWGGIENHRLNLYRTLLKRGYYALIVADPGAFNGSKMEKELKKEGLSFIGTSLFKKTNRLYAFLRNVCKKQAIDLMICGTSIVPVAKKIKKILPVKILCEITTHGVSTADFKRIKGIDGVLASSPFAYEKIKRYAKPGRLSGVYVGRRIPLIAQDHFVNFTTTETKEEFFKNVFGISVSEAPLICMIGNMYENYLQKNHDLLFQAIFKLIYEKGKKVEVVLAGDGVRRPLLEKKVSDMRLERYVHFLGLTDKIPALLHFSDLHVLTSSMEAFGAVYIEAGFMHKPSIGATQTGAIDIIQDGKTGFLFKNGDVDDLVVKIEILLDNPAQRLLLGKNAYEFVMQHYSTDALLDKYQQAFDVLFRTP